MAQENALFRLTVLGSRGSMPLCRSDMIKYGGNTSSYLLETRTDAIILDAGTGILNIPDTGEKKKSLLISHSHMDHVVGLPQFLTSLFGKELTIYGSTAEGLTMRQQLDKYISRPLWPITLDDYNMDLEFIEARGTFNIGDVTVTTAPSNHPGGSTLYKLDFCGKKVVYATDFEHEILPPSKRPVGAEEDTGERTPLESLAEFSMGADLILYDAQYTPEEYVRCRGFGHSTYEKAIELKDMTGAGKVILVHHNPSHNDEYMDRLSEVIRERGEGDISFAREGSVYNL